MRVAQVHVQSMRLVSGEEALVARVLTEAGTMGFGFSFELEATPARHMAIWDAASRERRVPLWKLLADEGAAAALGPAEGPLGSHPWERARRATIAAAHAAKAISADLPAAGAGIDWSAEPGFAALRWLPE